MLIPLGFQNFQNFFQLNLSAVEIVHESKANIQMAAPSKAFDLKEQMPRIRIADSR